MAYRSVNEIRMWLLGLRSHEILICCVSLLIKCFAIAFEIFYKLSSHENYNHNYFQEFITENNIKKDFIKQNYGLKFLISTVIGVTLLCIIFICSIIRERKLYTILKTGYKISTELKDLLTAVIVNIVLSIDKSPHAIYNLSSLNKLVGKSIINVILIRVIFLFSPFIVPVISLCIDVYNLKLQSKPLFSIPNEQYKITSEKIKNVIKEYNLKIKVYNGSRKFGFVTLKSSKDNIIFLGPKDNFYNESEIESILMHEIFHVIDDTIYKRENLHLIFSFLFFIIKSGFLIRIYSFKLWNRKFELYSKFLLYFHCSIYFFSTLVINYICQKEETGCDNFSKQHFGSKGLISWLIKYHLDKSLPFSHAWLYNLIYSKHPTPESRIFNLLRHN